MIATLETPKPFDSAQGKPVTPTPAAKSSRKPWIAAAVALAAVAALAVAGILPRLERRVGDTRVEALSKSLDGIADHAVIVPPNAPNTVLNVTAKPRFIRRLRSLHGLPPVSLACEY